MINQAGPSASNARGQWWFWALLAVCWFSTSGIRPLLEPDEGRYAEIPREMWSSGDWVTPRLNGLKYFEKPPLQYWATAAAYSAFGVSEWTARWFAVTLAFLCVPLVYAFAAGAFGSAAIGLAAAVALSVNPVFVILGNVNLLDNAFAFLLSAAVFAFLRAQLADPGSAGERIWALSMWAALALAALAKGIAAPVLAGATLVVYSIVTRDFRPWRRLHWLAGLALFGAIALPWFVLVASRNPEFLRFFFVHEHFERFLTRTHNRVEPWWYFAPLVIVAVLPWVRSAGQTLRRASAAPGNPRPVRIETFLLIWCAVVTLFFSMSQSKLAPYILPIMPALAVALAPQIANQRRWLQTAARWVLVLTAIAAIGLVGLVLQRNAAVPVIIALTAAGAGAVAVLGVVVSQTKRFAALASKYPQLIAAGSMLSGALLVLSYSHVPPLRTAKPLVAAIRGHVGPSTELFSVGQYRQTVPPYLGRSLQLVDFRGEMDFGLSQENPDPELSIAEFLEQWRGQRDAIAFVNPSLYARLGPVELPGQVLASDGRSIVVKRQ